jgi:hypothetical protein
LQNIHNATSINRIQIIKKIIDFKHQTTLPLNLKNFSIFYNIPLEIIFKKSNWKRLCVMANVIENFPVINEKEIYRAISKKWLSCNSAYYFQFILKLAKIDFKINYDILNEEEKSMCLMLHYDVWQNTEGFTTIEESINAIGKNKILNEEIIEVLNILIDKIDFIEKDISLGYSQPLKVYGRYTREQILAAFGDSTFSIKSNNREGVVNLENKKTELLLVTLEKSEENYSPTTMYNDFAVNETLFHWQSQNSSRAEIGRGLSYIQHQQNNKKVLLFIRERNVNEFGNRMGYVFLGFVNYKDHYGSKPMNINWEIKEPIPHYIWKFSTKMAIG